MVKLFAKNVTVRKEFIRMVNLPRVTQILQVAGLVNFDMVKEDVLRRACAFGSAVHKACELWDSKILNIVEFVNNPKTKPLVPYLESWKQFLKDYDLSFEPEEIENRLISEKYGFGGMPDRWHRKKGILPDIKTSTQMYPSTAIQTMAYQMLVEENYKIKIKKRLGVQLTEKGYKISPYTDSSDKAVFLACLHVFNWKKRYNLLDKRQ